jgi:glycosyltransferase involved in cell wall biosynthesis
VSIGVPTYDRPGLLRHALECILAQSHRNLEIIVSDNASPGDETERVVRELAARDPRIRYHRQPSNLGPLANFRTVLEMARGEYFAWVADDDACHPNFLRELLRPLQADAGVALAMSDFVMVYADHSVDIQLTPLRIEEVERAWPRVRRRFFAYPSSHILFSIYGLFRTEMLRRCRLSSPSRWKGIIYASEIPLLAQLTLQGKIVSIPQTLKTYVVHDGSAYLRERKKIGRIDRIYRDVEQRIALSRIALRSGLPWTERVSLAVYPWISAVLRRLVPSPAQPVPLQETVAGRPT